MPAINRSFVTWSGLTVAIFGGVFSLARAEEPALRFNRDVQPILSANCYFCHGPDDQHRQAELRFDTEKGVAEAFGGGRLAASEAWRRIISDDPAKKMPPPDSHKELKASEITVLRRWIEQGAPWEGHWAFVPPGKPALPEVKRPDWSANVIDRFILAELERAGLTPAEPADRERLLRRVTFDLTGLPPTIAETDRFLADPSPNAFETVVDRLLASERFGERMAMAWMDAARYGDSSVFHADGPRDMWPWRDWVIRAYNANLPFDQFTVEQLAGDLLPNASVEQKIATGFNRNNATTDEGGAIAEEFRVEYAVDRVKTTSMVWLGLTMECAQCHDHKYDPISQRDYYRFFAYFNQAADPGMQTRKGNQAPLVNVLTTEQSSRHEQALAESAKLKEKLAARAAVADGDFQNWLVKQEVVAKDKAAAPEGVLVHYRLDEQTGTQSVDALDAERVATVIGNPLWAEGKSGGAFRCDGGNFLDVGAAGDFERTDSFSYGAWVKPQGQASGAPLARMDDRGGHRGYDLYFTNGRVAVHLIHAWPGNAVKVTTQAALKPDAWQHVFVTYDGSSKAEGIKIYFDGKPQPWSIEKNALTGTIRTDKPLYLGRRNPGSPYKGLIDEVQVFGRALTAEEVTGLAGGDPLTPLLALPAPERTAAQAASLRDHYLQKVDEPSQKLRQEISQVEVKVAEAAKPLATVMVMQDLPKPRMTYILDRGNYASPRKDQPVEPGVASFLPALPADAAANRLGLARWLVDPNHPLTARVTVNRFWYHLFGEGLVTTIADFGAQVRGRAIPLLDWLAVDFVEHGWDVKRTLKQMVMSSTYRQSSRIAGRPAEIDPANRLLAHGPRFRLPGEMIRDNALAASGLLVPTVGGPSVKPYQPLGLWTEVALDRNVRFVQDKGEKLYRRSMYTYWKRSAPAPSLTIFDAPTRETCSVQRARTNTPLQALVTLNDPQFLEASRALAQRAIREGGATPEEWIVHAHRLAVGVRPKPATLKLLKQAYVEELAVFTADVPRAKKFLAVGESPRDEGLDPAVHAALSIITGILFNLDETITRG